MCFMVDIVCELSVASVATDEPTKLEKTNNTTLVEDFMEECAELGQATQCQGCCLCCELGFRKFAT